MTMRAPDRYRTVAALAGAGVIPRDPRTGLWVAVCLRCYRPLPVPCVLRSEALAILDDHHANGCGRV